MSKDTSDILIGAAILIPFLALIFAAAKVLAAFSNARFKKAFAPLLPLVAGRMENDGLRGQLFGTYEGRSIALEVITGARNRMFAGHPNQKRNLMKIQVEGPASGPDWRFHDGELRILENNPDREASILAELTRAGALELLRMIPSEVLVRYSSNQKLLTSEQDIAPALAPTSRHFLLHLEVLSKLAAIAAWKR
jgi:hypothetical protein